MKKIIISPEFINRVADIIEIAKGNIYNSVNFEMVKAYWLIGK